ncbi:MAG: translation elongation factor Ts [Bauldia sp.]
MNITPAMVKELREKTGAGMMDCKAALNETKGDMEAAVDWLRAKGLAKAAKKEGRVAAEGLVGIATAGNKAVMVEVNSETDFVARNAEFQALVSGVAKAALATDGSIEAVARAPFGGGKSVDEAIKAAIGTIGENMTLRRAAMLSVPQGVIASYVHSAAAPGLGRIGVLVGLESSGNAERLNAIGRQVAMHVAAANPSPVAVRSSEVAADLIEREKAVYREQAKQSGKPEAIVEKMVEGRLRKYFEEVVLLQQNFVINPELTVEKALKAAEKDAGGAIAISKFVVFRLGEGVDKGGPTDFAAEVASMAKKK